MGFDPRSIGYLAYAQAAGLGAIDLDQIEILGDPIATVARRFVPHSNHALQRHWPRLSATAAVPRPHFGRSTEGVPRSPPRDEPPAWQVAVIVAATDQRPIRQVSMLRCLDEVRGRGVVVLVDGTARGIPSATLPDRPELLHVRGASLRAGSRIVRATACARRTRRASCSRPPRWNPRAAGSTPCSLAPRRQARPVSAGRSCRSTACPRPIARSISFAIFAIRRRCPRPASNHPATTRFIAPIGCAISMISITTAFGRPRFTARCGVGAMTLAMTDAAAATYHGGSRLATVAVERFRHARIFRALRGRRMSRAERSARCCSRRSCRFSWECGSVRPCSRAAKPSAPGVPPFRRSPRWPRPGPSERRGDCSPVATVLAPNEPNPAPAARRKLHEASTREQGVVS